MAGLIDAIDELGAVILKMTGYVMALAPIAICTALAATVLTQGIGMLLVYAKFIGGFYLSLLLLWALLSCAVFLCVGRRVGQLWAAIRAPVLIAFSTASSEAAYPRTLEGLENFGVSPRIASFVLPLGYSFNLDGSTMYCAFAVLFIAQVFHVDLTLHQKIAMVLILMVTSKGMAGVPRASLMVIASTLSYFGLPDQGLVLIVAVDHLLDMGRSATNVVGNAVASTLVARWEHELRHGGFLARNNASRLAAPPHGLRRRLAQTGAVCDNAAHAHRRTIGHQPRAAIGASACASRSRACSPPWWRPQAPPIARPAHACSSWPMAATWVCSAADAWSPT